LKGFPSNTQSVTAPKIDNENVIKKTYNHFIVYGATETCKSTFIQKYIPNHYKKNLFILCKDKDEWKGFENVLTEDDLESHRDMENFAGTKEIRKLILLDDMGNLINQRDTSI
jgi:hypothetical protein